MKTFTFELKAEDFLKLTKILEEVKTEESLRLMDRMNSCAFMNQMKHPFPKEKTQDEESNVSN